MKGRDHFRPREHGCTQAFSSEAGPPPLNEHIQNLGRDVARNVLACIRAWASALPPYLHKPDLPFSLSRRSFTGPLWNFMHIVKRQLPTSWAALWLPQPAQLVSQLVKKQAALHKPWLFGDGWESAQVRCSWPGRAAGELWRCVGNTTVVMTAMSGLAQDFSRSARDGCKGSLALAAAPSAPAEVRLGLHYWFSPAYMPICSNRKPCRPHNSSRLVSYTRRRILTEHSDRGKHPCNEAKLLSDR